MGLGNSSCSGAAAAVCGNLTIPYPFGIKPGCDIDDWFAIGCNHTLGSPKPFLRRLDLEVLDISLGGTLRVNYPMSWWCPTTETKNATWSAPNVSLASSPFFYLKIEKHIHCHGLWQLGLASIQRWLNWWVHVRL